MPLSPILFLGKSYVGSHVRRLKNGKVITVGPYYDKRIKKGTEHVRAPLGRDFEDVQGLSPESMDLLERMHKEQHLLHHYHGHALRKRIAEHAEAIKSLTETAKAHRAAGKEVEATQAVNRALKRKSDLLRHQKELAEVDAKVAGIGAMMAKISPGAGDVYDSTEDSHKQYVDKMGSRWKASPRSPAKVTIPPAVEQSLMRLLGGFRSYAEGLERARATDQQFNGDGRYANEYAQNNKDRLEASEAFLAAKLGSIVNAANRAAAEEFIAKHRPDTNLTAHEQGFFGAKPADKKDEAIQAAVDHLKEDATQQDIPAKEKREDAALVAKLEGAKDAEPKATGGESGPFGPIFRQFHHDAQGAIEHLKQAQTGEAVAALHHPEVGDIDLVWGRTSDDPRSTGEGLAKLLRWHPEVLGDLQGFISSLHVHQKHKTRIHLTNDLARRAAVRLDYSGKTKTWLLTAYEVNSGGDRSGVGSASGGISAAAGRKDETILAPSPSASDDSSIAQAVGSGKDSAPQEGEVNAEGLVFRGGRWHRDGAGQKPEAAKTQQSTPAGDDSLDPNSPNYRYRDTGVIEGARKFNVTEAFREAARKGQLVRYQNIDWGELEENPRRAKELITKSNLFGKVDWDSLKEQGMEPGAGFLIDRVYASIASAPEDSPERRKDYALGIGSLRDRLETCKTPDEVKKTLSEMGDEFKGEILSARESEEYKAAYSRYQEIMGRVRAVDKQSDALYEPVKEMLNELRTLTYERDKRARRGWKPDPDSAAKIAEITQLMEAAEKKFRDFRAANASYLDNKHRELGNGRYTYASDVEFEARHALDDSNAILRLAALRNMQSNPTTRAWVSFGPKFQQIIQGRNDTFNGHRANVRAGNVSDWSWAEKTGSTPRSTKKGAQFQLLVADKIERVGGKDVLSASTEELKAQFGLRDVQSGNWVLKDIGSAQWHVQRATEAFSDLADLVGADPKQVAMNGRLALAFGARGTGNAGYGGAARAHYEPVDRIINITKMQGGGSLGHEWFHALDNLIGDLHGKQGGAIQFSSEEPDGLPAGLKEAFTGLTQTMMSGEHRMQQRVIVTDADRDLAKRYFDRPTSSMSRNIVAAGGLLGAIQAIDRHQGARQESLARFGKKLPPSERKTYDRYRLLAAAHYGPADATTVSIPSGAPMSSFALEAAKLDQGKTKSYWGTPKELAARAFSAWCEDRLRAQGRKNDYLSSHADNKFYQDPIFGDAKPFPEGEERTRINAAFDRLFAAMAESNTFAKALAMLESEQSRVLFFKSYVPAHTRRTKAGAVVQVAAYYDKRSRKGVELAGGHHHDLSHLDDTQRTKFEQMHKEQHLLHHYQAHALKKKIAEHEAEQAKAEKEAQEHREAGRHVDATKAANRALRAKSSLSRHRRELEEVNAKVAGIGAMKDKMVAGSGAVGESTDEGHDVYAKKLGHRWRGHRGPFGPVFTNYQGKPEQAIAALMRAKDGEALDAFSHPILGGISFIYGDEKKGLAHIEAKRGISFVEKIPEVLRNGRVEKDAKLPRAYVVDDSDPASVAVVRLDWDGRAKTWLVTLYPDTQKKFARQVRTSNGPPASTPPRIPDVTEQSNFNSWKARGQGAGSPRQGGRESPHPDPDLSPDANILLNQWRASGDLSQGTGTPAYAEAALALVTGRVPPIKGRIKFLIHPGTIEDQLAQQPVVAKPNRISIAKTPEQKLAVMEITAAKGGVRYYLNGVLLDRKNQRMASTDGHRAFMLNDAPIDEIMQEHEPPPSGDAILRHSANIKAEQKKRDEDTTRLGERPSKAPHWTTGKYPDMDRVIPSAAPAGSVVVDANSLAATLNGMVQGVKHMGMPVFYGTHIETPEGTRGVMPKYLLDAVNQFRALGYDRFSIGFNDVPGSPIIARSLDGKAAATIMPISGDSVFQPIRLSDHGTPPRR